MRNLILEEKIVISESTAISKIVFQALIANISKHIISEKMKKAFCKKTLLLRQIIKLFAMAINLEG